MPVPSKFKTPTRADFEWDLASHLTKVTSVGHDFALSEGTWTCGKEGQSVPVGVGIPTVKISSITVGGTEV